MTDRTGLRMALGALAGLALGAVGVLVLPPLLVPGGDSLEDQAAAILPEPEPAPAPEPASALPPEPASSAVAKPDAAPASVGDASPIPGPATPAPPGPGFDTVRVEPDGSGVIAGRAEPGAAVAVLADEEVVAEAEADEDGNFVAFLSLGPAIAPRALSLRDGNGRPSEETVILAPTPAPASPGPAVATAPPPATATTAALDPATSPRATDGAGAVDLNAPAASPGAAVDAREEPAISPPALGATASETLADAGPALREEPGSGAPPVEPGPALRAPDDPGAAVIALAEPPVTPPTSPPTPGPAPGPATVGAPADPEQPGTGPIPLAEPASPDPSEDTERTPAPAELATASPEQGSPSASMDPEPGSAPAELAATAMEPNVPSTREMATDRAANLAATAPEGSPASAPGATVSESADVAAAEPPGNAPASADLATPPSGPREGRALQPDLALPSVAADAPSLSTAPSLAGSTAPLVAPGAATSGLAQVGPLAPDAVPQAGGAPAVTQAAPSLPSPGAPEPPGQSAVLLSDAQGVRVLQPALPPGADPEVLATVALDAIAYDGAGEVVLSGRANGGAVRLYLDNRPVGEAAIGADGQWSAPLPQAEPGTVHTLRLDQLGEGGEVLSRIETPFQREERAALEAAMADTRESGQTVALRVVQPGNTLWAIARDRYGEPLMYVRVFEANRDRIRNPDLIYPGQVFVLPEADAP